MKSATLRTYRRVYIPTDATTIIGANRINQSINGIGNI